MIQYNEDVLGCFDVYRALALWAVFAVACDSHSFLQTVVLTVASGHVVEEVFATFNGDKTNSFFLDLLFDDSCKHGDKTKKIKSQECTLPADSPYSIGGV